MRRFCSNMVPGPAWCASILWSFALAVASISMKALVFERNERRYAAAMVSGRVAPGVAASVGPLSLTQMHPPELPDPGWERVAPRLSGICGSDIATLLGHTSRYFEPLVSFPFVMGHEIVGQLESGERVVIDAVLGAEAHGELPDSPDAAPGDSDDYGYLISGPIGPGLQIGSCEATGGGWSESMVAHRSQLHSVDAALSDEAAVMIEPTASGVHAALRVPLTDQSIAVVLGAGTIGLATIAALRALTPVRHIVATAKYPHQKRWASELGADEVVAPGEVRRAVRRVSGSRMIGTVLSGGADVVIDAVGSQANVSDALAVVRPRGSIVVCGMPGKVSLDLAPLWHRETNLCGCYTYGTEHLSDGTTTHSFTLAAQVIADAGLERLVTATYRLEDYKRAVRHAIEAGARGAVKIAFDLRD